MATTATSLFDDHVRVDVPQGASVVAAPGEPTAFVIEGITGERGQLRARKQRPHH